MKNADVIITEYNFWVNKYQFNLCAMQENETPKSTFRFVSEKLRESITYKLQHVAELAFEMDEPDLAASIQNSAAELGTDGIPPIPL